MVITVSTWQLEPAQPVALPGGLFTAGGPCFSLSCHLGHSTCRCGELVAEGLPLPLGKNSLCPCSFGKGTCLLGFQHAVSSWLVSEVVERSPVGSCVTRDPAVADVAGE